MTAPRASIVYRSRVAGDPGSSSACSAAASRIVACPAPGRVDAHGHSDPDCCSSAPARREASLPRWSAARRLITFRALLARGLPGRRRERSNTVAARRQSRRRARGRWSVSPRWDRSLPGSGRGVRRPAASPAPRSAPDAREGVHRRLRAAPHRIRYAALRAGRRIRVRSVTRLDIRWDRLRSPVVRAGGGVRRLLGAPE